MKKDVIKCIDEYGYDKARNLILVDCYTLVEFHKELGYSDSNSRVNTTVYSKAFEYLDIKEIPYKLDTRPMRLFKTSFDRVQGRYWESEYISEVLLDRILNHAVINSAGNRKRLVISFPKHPKADPVSNQIKAHIVLWELLNEQYVPENCWVMPKDDDYTNLDPDNWELKVTTTIKSEWYAGINNPAYQHGKSGRHKLGGWSKISSNLLASQSHCSICGSSNCALAVHHIINYHLFNNPIEAHTNINLLVLCQSCHAKIHLNNINIKAHIEETRYSKLLELLETLKSQVPDSCIEIYKDVEQQLGLTDNQQPSTLIN